MKKMITLLIIPFLVLSFNTFSHGSDSSSEPPSIGDVAGDILVIRPLGVIGLALGGAAFVISFPVTSLLKKTDQASEFLLQDTYNNYVNRPLGEAGNPDVK